MTPVMVVHPYRPDLDGTVLSNFTDPSGKKLFMEAVRIVKDKGEGYTEYDWEFTDGSGRIVPKISFVRGFTPWNWVLGTGMYIEDVRNKIFLLIQNVLAASVAVTVLIVLVMAWNIRSALRLEKLRSEAESELVKSRERYRLVAETGQDGVVMFSAGRVIFMNPYFTAITGYHQEDISYENLDGILPAIQDFRKTGLLETSYLETNFRHKDGSRLDASVSLSLFSIGDDEGLIVHMRRAGITAGRNSAQAREELMGDLAMSRFYLLQPVSSLDLRRLTVSSSDTLSYMLSVMEDNAFSAVLVEDSAGAILGIVTDNDLRRRVLAPGLAMNKPVREIMSAPLFSIKDGASVFEAVNLMVEKGVSHLAVRGTDENITGLVDMNELMKVQAYSATSLMNQARDAESVRELVQAAKKMPHLAFALLDAGFSASGIHRIMTDIADIVISRAVDLAVNETGIPPCDFDLVVFGSLGRREHTPFADQDNALIYKDDYADFAHYFNRLGQVISMTLREAGFPLCPGGTMVSNPLFNRALKEWVKKIGNLVDSGGQQDVIDLNILMDMRCVYGSGTNTAEVRDALKKDLKANPAVMAGMKRLSSQMMLPVDIFGNVVTGRNPEKPGRLDIKSALQVLIAAVRLEAYSHNIEETGTLARLASLRQAGLLTEEDYGALRESFEYLARLRMENGRDDWDHGIPAAGFIDPSGLNEIGSVMLKTTLSRIALYRDRPGSNAGGIFT